MWDRRARGFATEELSSSTPCATGNRREQPVYCKIVPCETSTEPQ